MKTNDYSYVLPEERIAIYPLPERDRSKLLIYKNQRISHASFFELADHLPEKAFLFFNNTKVIPARLHFTKDTGATIEIFLLHPVSPSPLLAETMNAKGACTWQCTIGNVKRWPEGIALQMAVAGTILHAELVDRKESHVSFHWAGVLNFSDLLHSAGETPLPPYLKRKAEGDDLLRYQTIYSRADGAVAAPTAGLHFTEKVFQELQVKQIRHDFVTLHVSAGTFHPIKTDNPDEHIMHEEQIIISWENVRNLLDADSFVIPVGTTSMRTLESLYWFGAKLSENSDAEFLIGQNDAYIMSNPPSSRQAIQTVLEYMDRNHLDQLTGETSIFIKPGYRFRICQGLITNFHQPRSSLILLVAAFVGDDWKKIYEEALNHHYRFLSYGDSSLLVPSFQNT